MATGDILSVEIIADGDRADITIEGLSTGGTYSMGLGTNNTTTSVTPKIALWVTSLGYDDTGTQITQGRWVYGTIKTREGYPNEALNEETASGGNVTVRVWLSDFIYSTDKAGVGNSGTDIIAEIQSGFYTQGTANNAKRNLTVTNSSTLAHRKVIANWTWPGYQRVTGSSFTLRCDAYQHHGDYGRPVRVVKFTVTDGTNTETVYVREMTIDSSMPDMVKVQEYIATIPTTNFTQGAVLTCNFIAYPWIGDSTSILDTSTGTAPPTPLYGPIKMLCDKNSTYGVTCALVDPTGSDAGANTVYDESVFNPATAYKFLTIGKAAAAIAAYNNTNRSRNDVGGGIVYLNAGSYNWLGSSNTYGSTPDTWITVMPASGVDRSTVNISGASGNTDISDRVHLKGVTITSTALNTFTGINAQWFDDCAWNTTGTGVVNNIGGTAWSTHGHAIEFTQGFRPSSTNNFAFALVRGMDLSGFKNSILVYTVVGNKRTGAYTPSSGLFINDYSSGMACPDPFNWILAYNEIYGYDNVTIIATVGTVKSNTFGGAMVSNVFENALLSGGNGMLDISASDGTTTNTPNENFILWNNTFVGQRCFIGYNDNGTITKYRRYWSQKNNYWDRWANKGDVFFPQNANRIGAWSITNMVGSSGNVLDQNMHSIPSNFYAEFAGLSTYQPAYGSGGSLTDADFVNRQSSSESVAGAGDGDYRINSSSSICVGKPVYVTLPYDLDGNARYVGDASGAYTFGTKPTRPRTIVVC